MPLLLRFSANNTLKLLLNANANVNMLDKFGSTPLDQVLTQQLFFFVVFNKTLKAAYANRIECAKVLIHMKANIQSVDGEGGTPLVRKFCIFQSEFVFDCPVA